MKTVTKFCKGCGKIMRNVSPWLRLCDTCRDTPPAQRGKPRPTKVSKPKPKPKPIVRKGISQCVREAALLGITYGTYVSRGYDRKELDL